MIITVDCESISVAALIIAAEKASESLVAFGEAMDNLKANNDEYKFELINVRNLVIKDSCYLFSRINHQEKLIKADLPKVYTRTHFNRRCDARGRNPYRRVQL